MSAGKAAGNTATRIKKELMIVNKLGIHARPAAMFVKTANQFDCEVFVEKDGETVNGKSIMGLMMLAAGPGSKIRVQADGADAARAVQELEALLKRKFDEDGDFGVASHYQAFNQPAFHSRPGGWVVESEIVESPWKE